MQKYNWKRHYKLFLGSFIVLALAACSSGPLQYSKEKELKKIDEFDQKVQIVIPDEVPVDAAAADPGKPAVGAEAPVAQAPAQVEIKKEDAKKASAKKTPKAKVVKTKKLKLPPLPSRRPPEIESAKGFSPLKYTDDGRLSRRPLVDPFNVGEKVTHKVHYYALSAGTMDLEVKPYATVNGRRNYNFQVSIQTSDWYSRIYSVKDKVTVLMDFETLLPSVFTLAVRETGQLKEARMLFDNNMATYWERKVTEKDGEQEKRLNWEILDYSQSVYSTVYYMRFFTWEVGQENAFRVADDNENLIFRGKAIRKEKITVDAGTFDSVVIQPQVELKGKFKPVGDIFIWLSDDEHKYILKIESKIKIGTLVSEATHIVPGQP